MSTTIEKSPQQVAPADLLPAGLAAEVEKATGARIAAVKPRGGGGASREGAELTLAYPDGRQVRAYMNYDVRKGGAGDDDAFLREAAILEALSGQLKGSGVRTAPFIASITDSRALIGEFVEGDADFRKLSMEDRSGVVADFMGQLATLHKIDAAANPVAGMGEVEPPSIVVRRQIAALRERSLNQGFDPPILLALAWLERNIPADPDKIVIVHGDAGPANFLYKDGKVTSLLDWELVHYGDAMADLAMLCLRNLMQPWVPMPEAFAAYEAAGGVKVDLAKVRFYRLYFQARFASTTSRFADPNVPPPPVMGMSMVYSTLHRRVLMEALAEASGLPLEPVSLPQAQPSPRDRTFAIALDDMRDFIVPRVADQQASAKAKGLVRLIKLWRATDRLGEAFQAQELAEISAALGHTFEDAAQARRALGEAIVAGSIDDATALRLCRGITARETALMADSMGALADSHFAALE